MYGSRMNVAPKLEWLQVDPQLPLRLFCFHYAGGNAHVFRPWVADLPGVEVAAIDLPGRNSLLMAKPFATLEPLIESLALVLLPTLREKPFAFFGHSMGAVVSFELSRYLRNHAGLAPEALFVSGRRAPAIPPHSAFHTLDDVALIKRLLTLNGTPREVLKHPELLQIMLPLIRADFAVCETYRYTAQPPLACPIYAYGGVDDPDVEQQHLAAWQQETSAQCSVKLFPGDHFYLRGAQEMLVATIAHELDASMTRAEHGV